MAAVLEKPRFLAVCNPLIPEEAAKADSMLGQMISERQPVSARAVMEQLANHLEAANLAHRYGVVYVSVFRVYTECHTECCNGVALSVTPKCLRISLLRVSMAIRRR
jgi:hypothetical protein